MNLKQLLKISIEWWEKLSVGMGDKTSIVDFVDRYLGYDEYGELSQKGLKAILSFVLRG